MEKRKGLTFRPTLPQYPARTQIKQGAYVYELQVERFKVQRFRLKKLK